MDSKVRVFMMQGEVLPAAFRWNGRTLRVLHAEPTGVRKGERRYRLNTTEGAYELGVETVTGVWHMRHRPSWVSRLWASVQRAPRYPLPGWRRRPHGRAVTSRRASQPAKLTAAPRQTTA
jgi:hypothetical protein